MGGYIIYFGGLAKPRIAVTVSCHAGGCKVSPGGYKVSPGGYKVSPLCPGPYCHCWGCKVRGDTG